MNLYKYIGPKILDLMFKEDGKVSLKCSYPKDYNDPYELFLTLDDFSDPEVVAYFNEIVIHMPQLPTTCFSLQPDIIPLWAHYAHQSRGIVIEFDEDKILEVLPESACMNVRYQSGSIPIKSGEIKYAAATMKPRHTRHISELIMSTGYFTKNEGWEYEKERRLVVQGEDVKNADDNLVISIPDSCVKSIIAGCHCPEEIVQQCEDLAGEKDYDFYRMQIGKCSMTPYFLNSNNQTYVFNQEAISAEDNCCENCGEPLSDDTNFQCQWCSITDSEKDAAADANPFRMLERYGLLDEYLGKKKSN